MQFASMYIVYFYALRHDKYSKALHIRMLIYSCSRYMQTRNQ